MGDMGLMIYYLVVALFSFFVVGPCILNTISLFGVQKRFAKAMVDEGIVSQEAVDRLHPKKIVVCSSAPLSAHSVCSATSGGLLFSSFSIPCSSA